MEESAILQALNQAQQAAVSAPLGNQLVLAGAGTGKTRVLTHRIVWLIQIEHLSPNEILAVTFTNKAALEMRSRIESMLHISTKPMWMGTFHGLSHRFLRLHYKEAGLAESFQILDSDDQQRLIRRVIVAMNLDEDRFPPKEAQWFINKQKEEGHDPEQVRAHDLQASTFLKIYVAYRDQCRLSNVIDFADLILKTCQVLSANEELRAHYQARFRALLVDEFQDTNTIQYTWLKLFAGKENAVMIVGDDDQSIYGWRGARIENIRRFSYDFPNVTTIRLEENYRSTETILAAANAVIAQNDNRLGKHLRTAGEKGEPITVYTAFNEGDEAYFIASRIKEARQQTLKLADIAILYRSNAQSRVLEEALMQCGLPYRVYGGLRYFDRAEIKDALAYLRLIASRADDSAFERIVNTPTRGIGDKTLSVIRDKAKLENINLWYALLALQEKGEFPARTSNALQAFIDLINRLDVDIATLPLDKQVERVIYQSGLIEHYRKEKGEKGLTRVENLEELVNAAYQFVEEGVPEEMPPLSAFLAYAALESGNENAGEKEDAVQLMTLHSAKGLEFPIVFLAGLEDELFPHYLSLQNPKAIEEERRLCYVGITRAMKRLYMTYAEERRMYGREKYHRPSRFLHEIPPHLIKEVRFRTKVSARPGGMASSSTPVYAKAQQDSSSQPFRNGQTVYHRIFGKGIVLSQEGDGDDTKVKVKFAQVGVKVLIASYLTV